MTLIVETGDFNPNASSYASVEEADARHAASIAADTWDFFDIQQKEQRLITATRRLDTLFDWHGAPYRQDQPLGFPRRNLRDQTGRPVYMRRVPVLIKNATIDLALWLSDEAATAETSSTQDVVEEITLGPIGIKMAAPTTTTTATTARPLIPSEILLSLRNMGDYVGGGAGVGRLVR